jgi:hypothetical protein
VTMANTTLELKLSRQLVRKNFDFLYVLRYTQNRVHRERERTFVTIVIEARRELGARSLVNYLYRAIQHSDFELLRDFKVVKCGCCPSPQVCNFCGDCVFCEKDGGDVEET